MKLPNHCRTKSLRGVTGTVMEVYPHLTSRDKICGSCRLKITKSYKIQEHNTPEGNLHKFNRYFLTIN